MRVGIYFDFYLLDVGEGLLFTGKQDIEDYYVGGRLQGFLEWPLNGLMGTRGCLVCAYGFRNALPVLLTPSSRQTEMGTESGEAS